MSISQSSNSAIVDWRSFSIGDQAHVDIQQPSSDANLLNRVTGDTTTEIHGRLTANGNVHIVNPNGIYIGKNGTINAGGFAASTLDIKDEDFSIGRFRYRGDGASAAIENAGRITIGRGGYAALMAGRIRNSGVITVPFGRIGFGAGEMITLDLSGDQFLEVGIPSSGVGEDETLIEHSGEVNAQGGLIEMRAATARDAARNAINLSGIAQATSVSKQGGTIVLGGGQGGNVKIAPKRRKKSRPLIQVAQSRRPVMRARSIEITGQDIDIADARIDASGQDAGGTIKIGGDFAGGGDLVLADYLKINQNTTITADAKGNGNGGRIVLWAEIATDAASDISARGGPGGGIGGFVEVSGRRDLTFSGSADLRAPSGTWGTLLLDPTNFFISQGDGGESDLEARLAMGNVVLSTSSDGEDVGNIEINAEINWTTETRLSLLADNSISIGSAGGIINPSGAVTLNAEESIGMLGGKIDVRTLDVETGVFSIDEGSSVINRKDGSVETEIFQIVAGSWSQITSDLPDFSAAEDFEIGFGDFTRALAGDGSDDSPYQIADIYGLQGIKNQANKNFELASDIDASDASGWGEEGDGAGFEPIPVFNAELDGAGHKITNLLSRAGSGQDAALFLTLQTNAEVRNLAIGNPDGTPSDDEAAEITGRNAAVLAVQNNGLIENVSATGKVTSSGNYAGGLVATNGSGDREAPVAIINDSSANVDVTWDGEIGTVGGFVGWNRGLGTINRSNSNGRIKADVNVSCDLEFCTPSSIRAGGFAGREGEDEIILITVNDSYSIGDVVVTAPHVTTVTAAGGFVGDMSDGRVNRSFSTGTVSFTGSGSASLGGFSGTSGTGSGNFWDTETSQFNIANPTFGDGQPQVATGLSTADFQNTETFMKRATTWDFKTVWAPGDDGYYPANYSTTPVILATPTDIDDVQYGLTPEATTDGTISGGPDIYVFDEATNSLDPSGAFADLIFEDEAVGSTDFTLATGFATSSQGIDFRIVDVVASAQISKAPLTLTVTLDEPAKTYGTALNSFTVQTETDPSNLYFDDDVESFNLASDGFAAEAPVADSPYEIVGSGATGPGIENYDITYVVNDLLVTPAPLTVELDDAGKTYGEAIEFDGTEFIVRGSGLLFDDESLDRLTIESEGAQADALVTGSPYPITGRDPVGTGLSNYDIDIVEGALNMQRAPLTVTPDDQSKTYGQELLFDGTEFVVDGLRLDDTVDSVNLESAGADARAIVTGTPEDITASAAEGMGIGNYDIIYETGNLTINRAQLTVTPNDQTKVEGQEFLFAGNEFSTNGLLFEDTISSVNLSSDGAASNAIATDGPFGINSAGATGFGLENYDIEYGTGVMTLTALQNTEERPDYFDKNPPRNPSDTIIIANLANEIDENSDVGDAVEVSRSVDLDAAQRTLENVQAISAQFDAQTSSCEQTGGDLNRYLACLSDSLSAFADELDQIASDLPPGTQGVARIIQDARVKIDAARTRAQRRLATATTPTDRNAIRQDALAESRLAVTEAAVEIRKAIFLIRADDPELEIVQRASIERVAASVDQAGVSLLRVSEL